MKRCYLIRHAQTLWNSENRLQGHSDQPLSPFGIQQAGRLAKRFAQSQFRFVAASHLRRTRDTAQAILSENRHPDPLCVEQGLAEIYLGGWEGLTPEEVDTRFAGAYQQWKASPSMVRIPGAEPLTEFRTRVRRTLARIYESFSEGECVVVTHGGVIASALSDVLGADYDALLRRLRLDNAGVTALEFSASSPPHVLWINSVSHLDGLGGCSNGSPAAPASA